MQPGVSPDILPVVTETQTLTITQTTLVLDPGFIDWDRGEWEPPTIVGVEHVELQMTRTVAVA